MEARALKCGLWIHGEYLRQEILGEPQGLMDLVGSALSIELFLNGQDPPANVRITETSLELYWWVRYNKPVLTCDSFYRSKHVWLGVTHQQMGASEVLALTKQKKFAYLGMPLLQPGLALIKQGWVPLAAPSTVISTYVDKIKVLLYLGLRKIPFDVVCKICNFLL